MVPPLTNANASPKKGFRRVAMGDTIAIETRN